MRGLIGKGEGMYGVFSDDISGVSKIELAIRCGCFHRRQEQTVNENFNRERSKPSISIVI